MVTLHIYNEELGYMEVEAVEVEASDICFLTDDHIATVEAICGWWEVYRLPGGSIVAYFEEE